MRGLKCLAAIIAGSGFSITAWAHDPGLSSANLTVAEHAIDAVAVFNARDLAPLTGNGANYTTLAPDVLRVGIAGKLLPCKVGKIDKDQNENVTFRLTFSRSRPGLLEVSFGLIDRLPFGHRQFVSVQSASGTDLAERLLSARENQMAITLLDQENRPIGPRFADFFLLGVRHILTGYDHLLFLFGLLLVARTARSAALLITCFTVAHSLTLALSTFGVVSLQSRMVEPAIAASIVYVGIENLFGDARLQWRWIITFGFGLVHGLGFAAVLREMGVASNGAGAVVPLFGFNLGVEAGQLSIAALVLPVLWKLRRHPGFLRFGVPACSIMVAFAGFYWLIERTLFT